EEGDGAALVDGLHDAHVGQAVVAQAVAVVVVGLPEEDQVARSRLAAVERSLLASVAIDGGHPVLRGQKSVLHQVHPRALEAEARPRGRRTPSTATALPPPSGSASRASGTPPRRELLTAAAGSKATPRRLHRRANSRPVRLRSRHSQSASSWRTRS